MRKTFIESGVFAAWARTWLPEDDLAVLQRDLMADPEKGAVMPGCGGLRKLRIADPRRGKGKRGGARVIYFHLADANQIHLVAVYGKDQKDDLSAEDKTAYRRLVGVLKERAKQLKRGERP